MRPEGLLFRKQHPFGPFVFDFYCKSAAVAIEVDGLAHDFEARAQSDCRRDEVVRQYGVETIRVPAKDVRNNLEGVVLHIVDLCLQRTPPPRSTRSPSPANAGEDVLS
jgi:very-short-patch-repair endonuclease